jgi:hypothetical protein
MLRSVDLSYTLTLCQAVDSVSVRLECILE